MKLIIAALVYLLLGMAQVHAARYVSGTPGSQGQTSEVMLGNTETPSQLCDYLKDKLKKSVACKPHGKNMVTVDAPAAEVKKYVSDIGAGTELSKTAVPTPLPAPTPPEPKAEAVVSPSPLPTNTAPEPEAVPAPPVEPPPTTPSAPAEQAETQTATQSNGSLNPPWDRIFIGGVIALAAGASAWVSWIFATKRARRLAAEKAAATTRGPEELVKTRDAQLEGLRDQLNRANAQIGETHQQLERARAELVAANKISEDWRLRVDALEGANEKLQQELSAARRVQPGSIFPVPIPEEMMADGQPAKLGMEVTSVSLSNEEGPPLVVYVAKSATALKTRRPVMLQKEITIGYILDLLRTDEEFRKVAEHALGRALRPLSIDTTKTAE